MTTGPEPTRGAQIRCTFLALRGTDPLFSRTVDVVDVPRVGERVHMWFQGSANVRGTVRDVRWTIPQDGPPTVTLQVEISPADVKRFTRRRPIPEPADDGLPASEQARRRRRDAPSG